MRSTSASFSFKIPRCIVAGFLLAFSATQVDADDWPQWRGPNRDAKSAETGLLTAWPDDGPEELWRIPIGDGFSGISIAAGRVYTMCGDNGSEAILCVSAADGKENWRYTYPGKFTDSRGHGPRATPIIANGRLFALGAAGMLHCLDIEKGEKIWSHDLEKEYGAQPNSHGFSCSPHIDGELVWINVRGTKKQCIMAFNKSDGRLAWAGTDEQASYSSPITIVTGGQRQLVFFTEKSLLGIDPEQRTVVWRQPWKLEGYPFKNIATPNFTNDQVFISSGYDGGECGLIDLGGKEGRTRAKIRWRNRNLKSHHANTIVHNGFIYGYHGNTVALLTCLDMKTGEKAWQTREAQKGDLIFADEHLFIITHGGELLSVEAMPKEYREKGRIKALEGQCWTAPSLADGRLFVRNNDNEMVCFSLVKK